MPTSGSLFSGIGGMDLGLERAGWECKWQVEIDDWRRQILSRHWPDVPKWADVCEVGAANLTLVDLLCGGFPCQDLSVAGKRAGLAGERSGLFFEFVRVAQELKPRWILIENVLGLLSSRQGEDIGIVIESLSELGYGVAGRVLDSKYFGVPQRRRRIYIVGCLGRPCPSEILFESEGGGGNPQTGGETGESIARALRSSPRGVDEHTGTTYVAAPLEASDGHHGYSGPRGDGADNLVARPLRRGRIIADSYGDEGNVVAIESRIRGDDGRGYEREPRIRADGIAWTLQAVDCGNVCAPADPNRVREVAGLSGRLDACPRCSDAKRYAALGDANTVPVIEWIGRRLIRYGGF